MWYSVSGNTLDRRMETALRNLTKRKKTSRQNIFFLFTWEANHHCTKTTAPAWEEWRGRQNSKQPTVTSCSEVHHDRRWLRRTQSIICANNFYSTITWGSNSLPDAGASLPATSRLHYVTTLKLTRSISPIWNHIMNKEVRLITMTWLQTSITDPSRQ